MSSEPCPICGRPVRIVSGKEGTTYAVIDELAKEMAPLVARLENAERALEDMAAERDDYKDRWETLGRVAKNKIERVETQTYNLDCLARDAVSLAEHLIGYVVGTKERAKLMEQIDGIRAAVNAEMNRQG